MNNKNYKNILEMALILTSMICISAILVMLFFYDNFSFELYRYVYLFIIIALLDFIFIFLFRMIINKKNNTIEKLNKLMQYDKKRKELEQEITLLTHELMHSDLSRYIDINRLVFEGQQNIINSNVVNFTNFLNQFGLQEENIFIKENSAVFLTPFNSEGEQLFNCCQNILGRLNIFLQRTDNLVEKDDIMMNIISLIIQSELVIVNIDGRNPNVYYELGIAHALGKSTILLSKVDFSYEDIGFDIRQKRIVMYKNEKDLEMQLLYQINRIKNK